ncbi:MAG: DUF971 domain-containing protein [Gemmatimonadetes bacterium]|nr:DUF971 domain-containing protein [Gemmatimonadota bacterium]
MDTEDRSPADASPTPRDLKVQLKAQRLIIEWQDGGRSEYSLGELRRRCPCATCRTEREKQDPNPLKILKVDPTDIRVTSAQLVGNYAIQFFWSDGHSTGIFDFRFLRGLVSSGADGTSKS